MRISRGVVVPTPTRLKLPPAKSVAVPTVVEAVREVAPVTLSVELNEPVVPDKAPARLKAPAELNVEVAVPPKYDVPVAEKSVVEA